MEKSEPSVLVLTLYSGENELDDALSALAEQTYTNYESHIFRHLKNVEAHRSLYNCIMESTGEFDLFVKLDADMVFNRTTALAEVVDRFRESRWLDHGVFAVEDWVSQSPMMGLHTYSNRVKWNTTDEVLFVDPEPEIPGAREFYWQLPVADHMPNPSYEQAFLFGYHRALKLTQRGRWRKNVLQAETQWAVLQNVWRAYEMHGDFRRIATLRGAEVAIASNAAALENKSKSDGIVRSSEHLEADKLAKRWKPGNVVPWWRQWRWVKLPRWLVRLGKFVLWPVRRG